jgi:hypothetical protein
MIISKSKTENIHRRINRKHVNERPSADSVVTEFIMQTAAIFIILLLSLAMITAPVFAESDNGADAHARSMSAGSGDQPIADESTTWDYGQSGEDSDNEQLSDEAEIFDEEAAAEDAEETADESEESGVPAPDDLSGKVMILLIAAAAVCAAALAAILIIRSMKKRL